MVRKGKDENMKDFKTKANFTSVEQKRLVTYLIYTFGIAWGTEVLLIDLYHLNLLSTAAGMVIHFLVLGYLWLSKMVFRNK